MAAAAASGGAEPMKDANVADEPLAQQREKETDGTTEGGQEGPAVAREVKEGKEGGSKEEGSSGVEAGGEKDDDDEGCGFCKFMRAGPCGHVFTGWEDCIDAGRKQGDDYVETCLNETAALKLCMEKNPEYYGPLLAMENEGEEEEQGGADGKDASDVADAESPPAAAMQ